MIKYAVTLLQDDDICKQFNTIVIKLLSEDCKQEASATSKWKVIKDSLLRAGETVLGWEVNRQPD